MENEKELKEILSLPRKFFVFIVLLALTILIGTFSFMLIKHIPFEEGFIRTMESVSFIFIEESGLGKVLEIFLALFGVFVIWWVLWTVADLFFEGRIGEYLKISKYIHLIRGMNNHYIIVGGGRVGEEIAHNLSKSKKDFLIIERDPLRVSKLRKKDYLVIEGDANDLESQTLVKANIKDASVLIIAMPETEKNLLLTLMAKEIKPEIEIYVRCDHPEFVSRLKKAGAKVVIVPEIVAAKQFIKELSTDLDKPTGI